MNDFLTAVGLMLVLEGLLYGGLPNLVKRMAIDVLRMPENVMRFVGLLLMAFGVFVVWLVRG